MAQNKEELKELYQRHLKELKEQGKKVNIILDIASEDANWIKNVKRT